MDLWQAIVRMGDVKNVDVGHGEADGRTEAFLFLSSLFFGCGISVQVVMLVGAGNWVFVVGTEQVDMKAREG